MKRDTDSDTRLTPKPEPAPYWLPIDLLHRVAQGHITVQQAEAIRAARAQDRRAHTNKGRPR